MEPIKTAVRKLRDYQESGATRSVAFRLKQLKLLRSTILGSEQAILTAMKVDLNKAPLETYMTEIGMVLEELNFAIRKLKKWTRPIRAKVPLAHFPARAYQIAEPYGVVLIIAPWNYPFQLTLSPLIGAIAAGNSAVVKPSEFAPQTAKIVETIVSKCFAKEHVAVIQGEVTVSQALLEEKFDYIFFTGSVAVGKLVMAAAAKHLTPVTLELGGKSPCIVDETADLNLAAKRIVWGKFLNAGQTCVAPDYLLVQNSVKSKLLICIEKYINQFYGTNPLSNDDYPKIINQKHFERLHSYLNSGEIEIGGESDTQSLQIAPTVLSGISWNDKIMQDEIFGPILPVLEFNVLEEAVQMVTSRAKPLALYLFTTNKEAERLVLEKISFGGGCINDTIVHLATTDLPFGGVGESGLGSYHGKWSFDTFSHYKSILKKSNLIDVPFRYPPYSPSKFKLIRLVLGKSHDLRKAKLTKNP